MKYVKFIKPLDGYKVDDVGSFENEVADRVVKAEYGEEVSLESTNLNVIDVKSKK